MKKEFEVFLKLCDKEGEVDRGMTIRKTYEAFQPCFEQYKKGDSDLRINLSGMTKFGLSEEEAFFILAYTSGTSKWINYEIKRNKEFSSSCKKVFSERLDHSLSKMPPFDNSLVYRMQIGVSKDTEFDRFKTRVKSKFIVQHYLSTAKEDYNNSEVTWRIRTLTRRSKGKDISDLSNHQYEKEVLFERNSKFEITAIDEPNNCILMQEIESNLNVDFEISELY